MRILYDHQKTFTKWAKARRSVPCWMEMRLGKTLAIKRWADRRPGVKRKLVVCPLSVIRSWRDELLADGVHPDSICELVGTQAQRVKAFEQGADHAAWFLINYEGLTIRGGKTRGGKPRATPSPYAELPWDLVILDESTRARSPRTQITKVLLSTLAHAPFKACLSGLPNPEGPENFVCQMLFLFGEFMGCRNYWEWRVRWQRPAGRYDWTMTGEGAGILKREVQELSFIMKKKDAGIGSKLVREIRYVTLPPKVLREHRSALRDFEAGGKLSKNKLLAMTWASQLSGGCWPHDEKFHHNAKTKELVDLATGELKQESLVVAATFTSEILAAARALEKAGVDCRVLHGKTKNRADVISDFQKGKFRALVCQPKIMQFGMDLSRATTTINLSRWWNYEVNAQFDERTEHPKKTTPRLCIDIVAEDTIDEDKITAMTEKGSNAKLFLRRFLQLVRERSKS